MPLASKDIFHLPSLQPRHRRRQRGTRVISTRRNGRVRRERSAKGSGCPARVKLRKPDDRRAYIKFAALQMEKSTSVARWTCLRDGQGTDEACDEASM